MNVDPVVWSAGSAGLASLLTYANLRRSEKRKDATEPVTAMATAASSIAGAVDDMIQPLRAEMRILREEVQSASINNTRLTIQLAKRAESEHLLREEVTALRLEVAVLRKVLRENGIATPQVRS